MSNILNECFSNCNSYVKINNLELDDVCRLQNDFMRSCKSLNLAVDIDNKLPHMILFPKFHKPKFSQRYVVSYANCSCKPLAKTVAQGLKAISYQINNYSNMIFKVTGIKRNWIINNNEPILNCLNDINKLSNARNIQTYDFTTLYTNLGHDVIKMALLSVIKLAFNP